MKRFFLKAGLIALTLACAGCVYYPDYYDEPAPYYGGGYYGYGPSYPWAVNSDIYIGGGHGDYGRGGHDGGWHGGGYHGGYGGWHH